MSVYVGERYIPIMGGEHNPSLDYENFTIVTSGGNAYISKKYVPSTTLITDTTFWLPWLNITTIVNDAIAGITDITGNSGTATKLQTARQIALTGDVVGSVNFDGSTNVSIGAELSDTGVSIGTYKSVTVDVDGRVTGGTNPTTLTGYGITDAVSKTTLTKNTFTLLNSFTDQYGTYYCKNDMGQMTISIGLKRVGGVTSGTTTIANIPSGYRPNSSTVFFPVHNTQGIITYISINSVGDVVLTASATTSSDILILGTATYLATI